MKPEEKKELKLLTSKFKKTIGVFSILFTILLISIVFLSPNSQNIKTSFMFTIASYIIYVFIRYIDRKLL